MTDPAPGHDLMMPHDVRYLGDEDVRGCPPNCPYRLWYDRTAAAMARRDDPAPLPGGTPMHTAGTVCTKRDCGQHHTRRSAEALNAAGPQDATAELMTETGELLDELADEIDALAAELARKRETLARLRTRWLTQQEGVSRGT